MYFIGSLLVLYMLSDVNFYLRCLFTLSYAYFLEKRRNFSEKTTIYGICTTQDVDINNFNHMNNARYLREIDFGTYHFYLVTELHQKIKKRGGASFRTASKIRYRRMIPIFTRYRVETELIFWDSTSIYFQHKFITPDGFVRAVAMVKSKFVNVDVFELMKEFEGGDKVPEQPKELKLWQEAEEISSEILRNSKL